MGERQADKIEALQARVAELEGRLRERAAWPDLPVGPAPEFKPIVGVDEETRAPNERELWIGHQVGGGVPLARVTVRTGPHAQHMQSIYLTREGAQAAARALLGDVVAPFAAVPPVLVAGEVLDEPRCGKPDPEGRACTLAADHARPDDHDGKPGPYTGAAALVMGGPLPPLLADEDDA